MLEKQRDVFSSNVSSLARLLQADKSLGRLRGDISRMPHLQEPDVLFTAAAANHVPSNERLHIARTGEGAPLPNMDGHDAGSETDEGVGAHLAVLR